MLLPSALGRPAYKGHKTFIGVTPRNSKCIRKLWCAGRMTEATLVFRGIFFGVVLSLIMWVMAVALIANIV